MSDSDVFRDIRRDWGEIYTFAAADGKCTATPKFPKGKKLTADNPEALLGMIRRTYRGLRADRSST